MDTDDRITPLDSYVKSELDYEWLRKSSFETRAFSLVTANVGFATLFFAISAQLNLLDKLSKSPSQQLLIAALACAAGSTALALLAALPRDYSSPDGDAIAELLESIINGDEDRQAILEELVRTRIVQLKAARRANDRKAAASVLSFIVVSFGALILIAALVFSVV